VAANPQKLGKLASLSRFADSVEKYTPFLRATARLSILASHIPGLKALRFIGHVERAAYLGLMAHKALRQLRGGGASPTPRASASSTAYRPASAPPPPTPFAPLKQRSAEWQAASAPPPPPPFAPLKQRSAEWQAASAPPPPPPPKPLSLPPAPYKPLFPIGPGTPAAFPHWQGDQGAAPPPPTGPGPSSPGASTPRAPTTPAMAAKTLARMAPPMMFKRFSTMPGAERRTPSRLPRGAGDSDGGAGGGLPGFGKGFGGGFGGSDGLGIGGKSDGGANGMGGNAEILQTMSQNVKEILDQMKKAAPDDKPNDVPANPVEAVEWLKKIYDLLDSSKKPAAEQGIEWARALPGIIKTIFEVGSIAGGV
jgi:hypothetical protein